jgi:chromosome segregation ATPase
MAPRGNDFTLADITATIQKSIEPLVSKLETKVDRLEAKVDAISQDRVTRPDMEKLRSELVGTMVPRDAYEPRHAALIARDTDIEQDIRRLESDLRDQLQRLHERLESGKQQIEDRFKQQAEAELSTKDRAWVRGSIISGWVAAAVAIVTLLLEHIRFN